MRRAAQPTHRCVAIRLATYGNCLELPPIPTVHRLATYGDGPAHHLTSELRALNPPPSTYRPTTVSSSRSITSVSTSAAAIDRSIVENICSALIGFVR